MFGITDLPTFLIGTVVTILLPGPNSLFVLSVAARQGVADGYRAACGVFLGDAILMLVSVAGMASLLAAYPELFVLMKLAGAAYLAWVGATMLRSACAGWRHPQRASVEPVRRVNNPFRRTLMICLLNPKAIFFFMAFFIQFVDRAYPHPVLAFAALGVLVQIISFSYLSALIFGGSRLAQSLRSRPRLAAGATGGAGAMFLGFSAKLASMAAQ